MQTPYIFVFIFVCLILLIILIAKFILNRPKYLKFCSLMSNGVKWKWAWKKGKIISLNPHCPECEEKIHYDDQYENMTIFVCNNCHFRYIFYGGDRDYVLTLTKREIMIKKKNLE